MKKTMVNLPLKTIEVVRIQAKKEGRTMASMIRYMVLKYLRDIGCNELD